MRMCRARIAVCAVRARHRRPGRRPQTEGMPLARVLVGADRPTTAAGPVLDKLADLGPLPNRSQTQCYPWVASEVTYALPLGCTSGAEVGRC
jgi:hypothetical protein